MPSPFMAQLQPAYSPPPSLPPRPAKPTLQVTPHSHAHPHSHHQPDHAVTQPASPIASPRSLLASHSLSLPQPTEVDYVLAVLDSHQSQDRLKLADDTNLRKLFLDFAIVDQKKRESSSDHSHYHDYDNAMPETICFSDNVTKLNRRHRAQARTLIVTDRAIYNFEIGNYRRAKRRILLTTVSSLTLSGDSDDFILHVSSDYDYHYRSSRRKEILSLIARRYTYLTGMQLNVSVTGSSDLSSHIRTRSQHLAQISHLSDTNKSLSVLSSRLRSLVSKKKRRYQLNGFDLDLTYISERIIAMGFPSDDVESLYRNPYSDVYRLLETKHGGHYFVYNLCSERHYESSQFHGRVRRIPFDDHNCPRLSQMLEFCQHASHWLNQNTINVIAIHCKAGKGRTGLMIAALLLYSGLCSTAQDALDRFGEARTMNKKGVTIPSQQRFVHYFERFLRHYSSPVANNSWFNDGIHHTEPVRLVSMAVCNVSVSDLSAVTGATTVPFVMITQPVTGSVVDTRAQSTIVPVFNAATQSYTIHFDSVNVVLRGEFKVSLYYGPSADKCQSIGHYWLHTAFLAVTAPVTLGKAVIDSAHKDSKHKKLHSDFRVVMEFGDGEDCDPCDTDGMDDGDGADGYDSDSQSKRSSYNSSNPAVCSSVVTAPAFQGADFVSQLNDLQNAFATQQSELFKATELIAELRAKLTAVSESGDGNAILPADFQNVDEDESEEEEEEEED